MCFSEEMSYINFVILSLVAYGIRDKHRLAITLFFLGIKDLIQGMLYTNIRNNKDTKVLTSLSWIHISFQPLFVNLFFSYFDKNNELWKYIFIACIIFGTYNITKLNEFDIQNDKRCHNYNKVTDYCSKNTGSYIGKYHLGYKFNLDLDSNNILLSTAFYMIIMFLPALFTKSRPIAIAWILFAGLLRIIFRNTKRGELEAIWCFLSIIFALPVALLSDNIKNML